MVNSIAQTEEMTPQELLEGYEELVKSGETANLKHWGDGKFVLGRDGKWHYEGFVSLLRALHEALRTVDPTIPPGLPVHVLDPEVIAKFFCLRLEDMNYQGETTAEPPKAEPMSPKTVTVDSPYLTAEEGAAYLRTTVHGIYSLVKRGRLHAMPGRRTLLFTRESLDKCATTRRQRR
jgi:hypothetical protein